MKLRRQVCLLLILSILSTPAFAGGGDSIPGPFSGVSGNWARKVLSTMSLDQKIGQLFMVAAYSNKGPEHQQEIEQLIRDEHIGGLIFMQGGPFRQVNLANHYQKLSDIPLMIAQDAEWGISMRLDSSMKFPRNMTLGAVQNDSLLYELGREYARQCKLVGVHVNFAPVVDVNNNPANPVINDRSFGENKLKVAAKGAAIMSGMQDHGVIACAKHFPGHGDTDTDSHLDLPVIRHSKERLTETELYPFKYLFEKGIASTMVAHLYIPSLDSTPNQASTLSPQIVNGLLRNEMDYRGLVFTDALNMKGVTKFYEDGEADLQALLAGNDILLFSGDVKKAKAMILKAVQQGKISEDEIDERVMRILIAKEWVRLDENRFTSTEDLHDLFTPGAGSLRKKLFEESITLVKNDHQVLPLTQLEKRKIALVQVGGEFHNEYSKALSIYAHTDYFYIPAKSEDWQREDILNRMKDYNTVLVGVFDMNKYEARNFGISGNTRQLLADLNKENKDVVVSIFGNPYSLKNFGNEDAILVSYEDHPDAQVATAEIIFGGLSPKGKLPVSAGNFKEGDGAAYQIEGQRFSFARPEEAGMDPQVLGRIDSIAQWAINIEATPGCAVLVIKDNKIVYDKAFGKTEYEGGIPTDPWFTIYDIASVTKVAATTVATMRLVDEGLIDIDESIAAYIPDFRNTGKAHIKVKNLLMHNAGFQSWIPFYTETLDDGKQPDGEIYSDVMDERFCVPVMRDMWICKEWQDTMWIKIVDSKLKNEQRVKYSDLSMIVLGKIIEEVTGTTLDKYVDSVFYQPLGMYNTYFNPHLHDAEMRTAPTEIDRYFRKMKVHGYVHDPAAAMFGGVAGHAGLFSNIYDLGKLFLMLENGGVYGDTRFIQEETINRFSKKQLRNSRRGFGFDKPEPDGKNSPASKYASDATYGHTGFTGTCVWVDPEYNLVYIFLSNRTFPDSENNKLARENVRPLIHDQIYKAIFAFRKSS